MHGVTKHILQRGLDERVIEAWTAEVRDGRTFVTMTRAGLSGPVGMYETEAVAWVDRLLAIQRHPSMREAATERAMRVWKMDEPPRTVRNVITTL